MRKAKRKKYSATLKAKVGMDALKGIKTVGQISREYEVHPVQVTQWKKVVRERLPELFESAPKESVENHEQIAQLHEKISCIKFADSSAKISRILEPNCQL